MHNPAWGLLPAILLGLAVLGGCEARPSAVGPSPQAAPTPRQEGPSSGGLALVRGFAAGYDKARSAGKPMLVFFTVRGCGYCEQMMEDASADQRVVRLSQRFVCILVDADAEPEVCRAFRVRGYPTVQFISPRGVPLNRLVGKTPAGRLARQMQAALEATASRRRHLGETIVR